MSFWTVGLNKRRHFKIDGYMDSRKLKVIFNKKSEFFVTTLLIGYSNPLTSNQTFNQPIRPQSSPEGQNWLAYTVNKQNKHFRSLLAAAARKSYALIY